MRIRPIPTLLAVALAACTLTAAQSRETAKAPAQLSAVAPDSARIVYTFDQPELQPPQYTITIDANGMGHFVSKAGTPPPDDTDDVYPAPMDREIRLDPALMGDLFDYARAHRYFNENCNRRGKLAFTGNKTISYVGPEGRGSCAFVWAADPALQQLSDRLNAVAFTLEIGRRLDVEMHHYPLGLDAELESLQNALENQQAYDLPNIAPELQYIASDQDVMNRVRRRALALLSRCENPQRSN
ncbi:MAG TPA: hypothetical protein VME18_09120 [Acidobacteriaceae bacterium]|nr:hypothetical protein [Acidobacteriaceae bacterium]